MIEAPLAINIPTPSLFLLLKIGLLSLIFVFGVFTFFMYNKVRSLNRIVFFPPRTASNYIKSAALFYFLLILSLFFITLVIV